MQTISYTDNATDAMAAINANLQEIGSVVELTTSMSATQLVTALNAEFYGISGVSTLSVDDNADDFCEKLNTNFPLASSGVKAQYAAEVTDTATKVAALLDGNNTLSFLLCTDVHYDPTESVTMPNLNKVFDDSANNMKAVANNVSVDALICLGDMIDGNSDTARSTNEASHMIAKLQSVGKPLYIALGNHDNNRNGNGFTAFTRVQMKTMFMDYVTNDVTFANSSYKSDYYKDYSSKALRVIVIYGNGGTNGDYMFNNETRTFLQTSLANLPNGYKAIVVTHVPPCAKMNYNNRTRAGGENIPSGESTPSVKDVIKNAGNKVIVMLYGHCHQDNVWADPFVSIGTCCNKGSSSNGNSSLWSEDAYMPMRDANNSTAAADLWDAVVVNTNAKRIDMVRFGAGADRTIHYEPIERAAGTSVTLTPTTASGGTWGLRSGDASKASVSNGVVTVDANTTPGTLLSVWYKSSDWSVNGNKQLTAGSSVEYWIIRVT